MLRKDSHVGADVDWPNHTWELWSGTSKFRVSSAHFYNELLASKYCVVKSVLLMGYLIAHTFSDSVATGDLHKPVSWVLWWGVGSIWCVISLSTTKKVFSRWNPVIEYKLWFHWPFVLVWEGCVPHRANRWLFLVLALISESFRFDSVSVVGPEEFREYERKMSVLVY